MTVNHVLIIFLDGIGLGADDPRHNPFAVAQMPLLNSLAGGRWLIDRPRHQNGSASFVPTDPRLGVTGRPQSATGQAAILTGRNVAAEIGEHYGPRPDDRIRAILAEDNLFMQVVARGGTAALIDAYPPGFFQAVSRGKRLLSSIQQCVHNAGLPLLDVAALRRGQAMSPDWTGDGWRSELGYTDTPVYAPEEAGRLLATLTRQRTLTFFSTWVTDVLGHRGPFERAVALLERFDQVMAGLLADWPPDALLIVTSDHGNMEDLSTRRHTENDVPTLLVGPEHAALAASVRDLTDLTPLVLRALYGAPA
ncbi:MAG: peptidase [Anaerolineae bacterium]|nr:peptidase [Anaerolineae bacterium]